MKTFRLQSHILIRQPIEEVFRFFTDAGNLDLLTPEWLVFRIQTPRPIAIATGVVIDYRLRLRGLPIRWRSCITAWEPPHLFIDEQVQGPYRQWIHQHRFRETDGGTQVEDDMEYAVWGGSPVNRFFVAPDLNRIFEYRRARLAEHFDLDRGAA